MNNEKQASATYAKNAMVATSQPLAAQIGVDIMKQGGNAIDAAIATAASLCVVEPTTTGIGGDAYAIVWTKDDQIHALNGSGKAPKNLTIEEVKKRGYESMPKYGVLPITVPGAPSAWVELSKRFGNLPFETVMQPAIDLAKHGFTLTPGIAASWKKAYETYKNAWQGEAFTPWFDLFARGKKTPNSGETWSAPEMAKTLSSIAKTRGESFYNGELAEKIANYVQKHDGFLTKEDLRDHKAHWVKPLKAHYKGYDVWEMPPNTQGLIALEALNIFKHLPMDPKNPFDRFHKQIEAMKAAFADGLEYIADNDHMKVASADLLSDAYAKIRSRAITDEAHEPKPGSPRQGGTIYLASADSEGNMVSFIQSNYMGFGSGIVIPDTGIAMQNRGHNFSLDKDHANALAPGKRSFHTIIPGFLSKNQKAVGPFGVMGGFMQPQGHLQVLLNTIDSGMNPQAALDAPRWMWQKGKRVLVEEHMDEELVNRLKAKGHDIHYTKTVEHFGRGQIVWKNREKNRLEGGSDKRADGIVAGF